MFKKAVIFWVTGLFTLVPYSIYYLLLEAPRDQYAILIILVLFWIFGFWGIAGPLLTAIKVRMVFRSIEQANSREDLQKILMGPDTKDAAIDLIASENHIPRFLASRVYTLLISMKDRSK